MNKEERIKRDAVVVLDSHDMSIADVAAKHGLSGAGVRLILKRAGVKATKHQLKRICERQARIRELAPLHSHEELQKLFPDISVNTIRRDMSKTGVRIGCRKNIRSKSKPRRQIEILADLRDNPNDTHSAIGIRHQCTRENVSQIAFDGKRFGFLPNIRPTEVSP